MLALKSGRRIARVPALHVSLLFAQGELPSAPREVIAAAKVPGSRDPTLTEFAALTWLLCGPVDKPYGVAAYRDVYDNHTSADVREVTHVAGSARAVVELIRFIVDEARTVGRRVIGIMDNDNSKMTNLVRELGFRSTRVRWEM